MRYYANVENKDIRGFYIDEIHKENIPQNCIEITEELWQELLSFEGAIRLKEEAELDYNIIYTKENLISFEAIPPVYAEEEGKTPQELEIERLRMEQDAIQEALNEVIMIFLEGGE